ncbi:MAG: thioredoxin family protein [Prevotella sp.]|nr:thioredoxin family protein [Prevotella sp.]
MKKILILSLLYFVNMVMVAQTEFRAITYQQALDAAKVERKMVFIDFYTDWCGPCKMMARDVFPQKNVGDYFNAHFVCIKLNAEKGEGKDYARQFKIDGYPSFLIVNTDGKEVGRYVGGSSADKFVDKIEAIRNPELTPARLTERYLSGERNAELIKAYASMLMDKAPLGGDTREEYRRLYFAHVDKVNKVVQEYFSGLSDAEKMKPENFFVYRNYTGTVQEAPARFLVANRKKFAPEFQQEVTDMLNQLFMEDVNGCLVAVNTGDAEKIKVLKKEIKQLGLNKDGHYDGPLAFLNHHSDTPTQFASCIDQHFRKLDGRSQTELIDGLLGRFANASQEEKNMLARSIRNQLPDMGLDVMFMATMIIPELEGTINRH